MSPTLKDIEKKLQLFFEDHLQRIKRVDPKKMASSEILTAQLNRAIESHQKKLSPNIFRVIFKGELKNHVNDLDAWKTLVTELIKESARENNLHFSGPVHIQHFFEKSQTDDVHIEVAFSSSVTGETRDLPVNNKETSTVSIELKGYLIISHDTIFPLRKKMVTIGRDDSNDLVVDNLRVSRLHAQIREIGNDYILFDLNSTAGTKVNNRGITQHKLTTGDVIEIADVVLIFSDDSELALHSQSASHTKILPIQGKE